MTLYKARRRRTCLLFNLFYELNLVLHFCLYIGLTTDGEFNSVRTSGRNRPISIIDVIRIAKGEARNMKERTIVKYFTLDSQGMGDPCTIRV
jgi:hypothetical protein